MGVTHRSCLPALCEEISSSSADQWDGSMVMLEATDGCHQPAGPTEASDIADKLLWDFCVLTSQANTNRLVFPVV